jgi:hypothetical protein
MIASVTRSDVEKRDFDVATAVSLLSDWVEKMPPVPGVMTAVPRKWVDECVARRLSDYHRWGRFWRICQIGAAVLTALLGILGSVLAGLHAWRGVAILAGALVAAIAAFTHGARPGQKADGYEHARLQIQDEVWNLVHHQGRYADAAGPGAYLLFYRTVGSIVQRKRTATDLNGSAPASTQPAAATPEPGEG